MQIAGLSNYICVVKNRPDIIYSICLKRILSVVAWVGMSDGKLKLKVSKDTNPRDSQSKNMYSKGDS